MSKGLNFLSVSLLEVPVTIGNESYVLREASGAAACQYRNAMLEATEFKDGKPAGVKDFANIELLLVSLCMFKQDDNDPAKFFPVALETVKQWPSRIIKALYAKAKEISELDEAALESNPTSASV